MEPITKLGLSEPAKETDLWSSQLGPCKDYRHGIRYPKLLISLARARPDHWFGVDIGGPRDDHRGAGK